MSYYVHFPTRNGAKTLATSLDSLMNQTFLPAKVLVFNDGSSDETSQILRRFQTNYPNVIHVFNLKDSGRDFRKIVFFYNIAVKKGIELCPDAKYQFVLADDIKLCPNYCEELIKRMENDSKLAVTSGQASLDKIPQIAPSGAARLIREKHFQEVGGVYPVSYAYESWILYATFLSGLKTESYSDLTFEHLRPLGKGHDFREFGKAMYCLCYHPLYVLSRMLHNLLYPSSIPKKAVIMMTADYFFAPLQKNTDVLIRKMDPNFSRAIRNHEKAMLRSAITTPIITFIRASLRKLHIKGSKHDE